VIELCSSNTISQLCSLIGREPPLSILGNSISLYFLRISLAGWNADDAPCSTLIPMIWSTSMWVNAKSNTKWRFEELLDTSKTKFLAHAPRLSFINDRLLGTSEYELKVNLDTNVGQA
jgi:hypothetical protein